MNAVTHEDLKEHGFFTSWTPLVTEPGCVDIFTPRDFYALNDADATALSRQLVTRFDLGADEPQSWCRELDAFRALRDEAREQLEGHGQAMKRRVMEPLRQRLVTCIAAVTEGEERFQTATELEDLWRRVGRGMEPPDEHGMNRRFAAVPETLATETRAAVCAHVEGDGREPDLWSCDAILKRADPAYHTWEASRRIVWSVVYDDDLDAFTDALAHLPLTQAEEAKVRKRLRVKDELTRCRRSSPEIKLTELDRRVAEKTGVSERTVGKIRTGKIGSEAS
jgi:hypothetical protein